MPTITVQYRDQTGDGPSMAFICPTRKQACIEAANALRYMATFDPIGQRRRWWHVFMWWL